MDNTIKVFLGQQRAKLLAERDLVLRKIALLDDMMAASESYVPPKETTVVKQKHRRSIAAYRGNTRSAARRAAPWTWR